MATYLVVNLIFLAAVIGLLGVRLRRPSKKTLIVLGILLVMTAVFDSLIIHFGIVAYDTSKILGVYVGRAPIEDFFYAVLALIIVVNVWERLGKRHEKS